MKNKDTSYTLGEEVIYGEKKKISLRDKLLFWIAINAGITDIILIINVIHGWDK